MTVSRVINNDARVSDATRRRVQQVIEDLHYTPHAYARRLAGGSTYAIGVVLCDNGRSVGGLYVSLLQGMQQTLAGRGHDLMFFSPQMDSEMLRTVVHSQLIEGFIVMGTSLTPEQLAILREGQLPFIVIGRREIPGYVAPFVTPNYVQAFDHLLSIPLAQGAQDIVVIMQRDWESPENTAHAMVRDRLAGVTRAVERVVDGPRRVTVVESQTFDAGYAWVTAVHDLPDAILLDSTDFSFGVAMGLHDRGVSIPEDVQLYGFVYQAEFLERAALVLQCAIPGWRVPWAKVARVAVEQLLEGIASGHSITIGEYVDAEECVISPLGRPSGDRK